VKQFLVQRWFLILLAIVLTVGISQWQALRPVGDARWLRDGVVATVLFLMALPLNTAVMVKSLRRPGAALLGFAINLGLVPVAAWVVSWGVRSDTAAGLLVAATTPCTLASAAVWTRRAGGNDAAAILVTILTNATCFLITPLWLTVLLGSQTRDVRIPVGDMAGKLGLLVVLPMALAQLLRTCRPVAQWATHHGKSLSTAAQCGILTMVLIGAIHTGQKLSEQPAAEAFALTDWLAMIAAVLGVHLAMLWFGFALAGALGMRREDSIAVGIAGSQKTLMVGLQVALDCGLLILPMVVYHVGQLLVDTIIADRWRRAAKKERPEPKSR
jgi:sodium/bile acid cotransporter 7